MDKHAASQGGILSPEYLALKVWNHAAAGHFVVNADLVMRIQHRTKKRSRSSTFDSAFTLVELLVVIGILGILAAILLPALSRAKQSAHLAKCASNLRQIELATTLYVTDNGSYPFYWTDDGEYNYSPGGQFWSDPLAIYLSEPDSWHFYSSNSSSNATWSGVYRCPGLPGYTWTELGINFGMELNAPESLGGLLTPSSYGVNSQGTDIYTPRGICGIFPDQGSRLPQIIPPVRESDILVPSDMVAFGDASIYQLNRGIDPPVFVPGNWAGFLNFPENYNWERNYYGYPERRLVGLRTEGQRHHGLFNVAFCDGHVEALKPGNLYGAAPDLTKRWNRDHEPHTEAWK